jgi:integrase
MLQTEAETALQLSLFDYALPTPRIDVEQLNALRRELLGHQYAANTRRRYAGDWQSYEQFCRTLAPPRNPLPVNAETLALYVGYHLSHWKLGTIRGRLAGILHHNEEAGHPRPSMAECHGLLAARQRDTHEQPQGKAALSVPDLRRISRKLLKQPTNRATRDRALLLFGFASGLRRSELVAVDLPHITFARQGIALKIPNSKTDQEGRGATLGIFAGARPETDPVRAVKAWLKVRGNQAGPLFTHISGTDRVNLRRLRPNRVSQIVKKLVAQVGLDPALYAPHSLRAGCATAAYEGGAPDLAIMRATRHKSLQTTALYVRSRNPFAGVNPLAKAL